MRLFVASFFGLCFSVLTLAQVAPNASDAKPLKAGDKVPAVTVRDASGASVRLTEVLAGKKTVVVFYRGGWCPFCNRHLAELAGIQGELAQLGYQTIAISPDRPEEIAKAEAQDKPEYRRLSDSKAEAIRAFGLAFRVDDKTFETYRDQYKIDLEKSSGETHHLLPVPAVFLTDEKGTIRYAYTNPDYRVRLKAADLLAAARSSR
ncbi:MAG: AhpC/TSA family protein [Nitrospirae bacterium]|nr:AhpC/TSA family protein [Fimbriimonadaceae bacterium]